MPEPSATNTRARTKAGIGAAFTSDVLLANSKDRGQSESTIARSSAHAELPGLLSGSLLLSVGETPKQERDPTVLDRRQSGCQRLS